VDVAGQFVSEDWMAQILQKQKTLEKSVWMALKWYLTQLMPQLLVV